MTVPLLASKLYIPPPRPELVSRPRLIARLNAGLPQTRAPSARKMTLISAPAGFGKTTLLGEWVSGLASREPLTRTAWLSLDQGDNDLSRFLSYVIASLRTVEGTIGQGAAAALQSPGQIDVEAVLAPLINQITALPFGLILVLDDYHVIESPPVDKALAFLVDHLPTQMHLVIATRADPTLPLPRLRARGQMTELRAADLRFTIDEAGSFLRAAVPLPILPEDVRTLEARTEGWITGLQLAALTMQGFDQRGQIERFIQSFGGSHRYVIDYLVAEVLDQQGREVQRFLVQTSILERLTGSLCNAVAERQDSQALLENLDASNLFVVPLDNERRWYRYHHLFADLLRQRLSRQQAGDVAGLHISASAWYEENGLEVEALHHAAAANDFERAARIVEGGGQPLYHRGAVVPVQRWLESLSEAVLDARPSLRVMYAEVLLSTGQPTIAEETYRTAEEALHDARQDADTRDLLGRIANGRASLAGLRRQPDLMMDLARRALELLQPDNLAIRAAASLSLGFAHQLQGDRTAARQAFAEAEANGQAADQFIVTILATKSLGDMWAGATKLRRAAQTYRRVLQMAGEQPLPYIGEAHLGLAQVLYEWNDLDGALRHGERGVRLAEQIVHTDRSIACMLFLARLRLAQGDAAGAMVLLDEVGQSVQQHQFESCAPQVAEARVRALLQQSDVAAASDLAEAFDLPVSRARVYLAQGDPAAALARLEPVRQQAEAKGWRDETLKVLVVQAIALDESGEREQSIQVLSDLLAMGEPEGYVRTFVDEGAPMDRLLHAAASRGIRADYTAKLVAAFEVENQKNSGRSGLGTPAPTHPLVEPLSQRELEVLRLVAQGLSNREISERLFLALDTVKGHNRRIFGKLDVRRRTEAVARAREQGLI